MAATKKKKKKTSRGPRSKGASVVPPSSRQLLERLAQSDPSLGLRVAFPHWQALDSLALAATEWREFYSATMIEAEWEGADFDQTSVDEGLAVANILRALAVTLLNRNSPSNVWTPFRQGLREMGDQALRMLGGKDATTARELAPSSWKMLQTEREVWFPAEPVEPYAPRTTSRTEGLESFADRLRSQIERADPIDEITAVRPFGAAPMRSGRSLKMRYDAG